MLLPLMFTVLTQITQPPVHESVKILVVMNRILSTGGPLKFDEKGICFIGEENSKSDDIDSYNGIDFKVGPEYWEMIKENRVKADAMSHIKVENGRVYHDGNLINFDLVSVKWINKAVFWQDWVVGIGLTSKENIDLNNIEPRELVYYNWKTNKGGSIHLVNKMLPEFKILTKK